MSLYSLLGLTLFCGLLVIIGMIGSFQPHPQRTDGKNASQVGAELKHGFKLLGLITLFVFILLVTLIIQRGELADASRYFALLL